MTTSPEYTQMLRGARKTTHMVTTYEIGDDGPIVPQVMGSGQMRVTRVVVTSYDNGHVDVEAKGYSVTKNGVRKSGNWMTAHWDIDRAFADALVAA